MGALIEFTAGFLRQLGVADGTSKSTYVKVPRIAKRVRLAANKGGKFGRGFVIKPLDRIY